MPGVSMIQEDGVGVSIEVYSVELFSGYISEKVVVCIPLWCADEMAPVRAMALPRMALSRVDLPTPELPESNVIRFWKMLFTSSFFSCRAEIAYVE